LGIIASTENPSRNAGARRTGCVKQNMAGLYVHGFDALAEVGLYDVNAFVQVPSTTDYSTQAAAVITKGFHAAIGSTPVSTGDG
jgi:hypothetical protein